MKRYAMLLIALIIATLSFAFRHIIWWSVYITAIALIVAVILVASMLASSLKDSDEF